MITQASIGCKSEVVFGGRKWGRTSDSSSETWHGALSTGGRKLRPHMLRLNDYNQSEKDFISSTDSTCLRLLPWHAVDSA
uniref:Uncharacterized protein n=1 Tax=Hyaloperonospora arabidopsidis (strain Emoy2) TaxID=559515 RepID=M4BBM1_HYAAE